MTKKIHIAISTRDISKSLTDYSKRLGCKPEIVIENEYALWRTETLNLSVRYDSKIPAGTIRHLGFEDSEVDEFSEEHDINGVLWERFNANNQLEEIKTLWPNATKD